MIGTIIVSAVLAVAVGAVIAKMIKDKKDGKSGCGCGCGSCPNSSMCRGDRK